MAQNDAGELCFVVFVMQPVRVEGQAMSPTLNDGDRILISKRIGEIKRGDIVVFLYPHDTTKSYIQRVVGLPGETIDVRDGKVFISGSPIEEAYLKPEDASQDSLPEPFTVEAENYFVLGDNRKNSADSRYWGAAPRKLIYGRYWLQIDQAHLLIEKFIGEVRRLKESDHELRTAGVRHDASRDGPARDGPPGPVGRIGNEIENRFA